MNRNLISVVCLVAASVAKARAISTQPNELAEVKEPAGCPELIKDIRELQRNTPKYDH